MIDEELSDGSRAVLIKATPVGDDEATPEREACGAEVDEMLSTHGLELDHADAGDDEPHPSLWDELMERLMAHLLFASTMALLLLAAVGVDSLLNRRRAARG